MNLDRKEVFTSGRCLGSAGSKSRDQLRNGIGDTTKHLYPRNVNHLFVSAWDEYEGSLQRW